MLLSILLFISAILLMVVSGSHKSARICSSITAVAITLLTLTYVTADYFTDNGIDESVVYHLQYGLQGTGFGEYISLFIAVTAIIFLIVPAIWYKNRLLSLITIKASKFSSIFVLLLLAGSILSHAATSDIIALNLSANASEDSLSTIYADTHVDVQGKPLNLVYIYLESLERTYLDQTLFPGLTPNLIRLEEKYTSFTDIHQIPGTGWTIAGMTASQCGVPLVTKAGTNDATARGEGNSMSGMSEFLPGATCIGDILQNIGYRLSYTGGAKLSFAGKGKFYKTHGFDLVEGKDELTEKLKPGDYFWQWGLYDDTLFNNTIEVLKNPDIKEPFGHFLLTLDTHNPAGHPSASCGNQKYEDGGNSMLNAVHCSDYMLGKLIDDIQKLKIAENTLIVITSDHLALRNTATEILNRGDRRDLFIAIPPTPAIPQVVDRSGSMLDVGITVLNLMGIEISKLGFGRDLLSDHKTLLESQSSPDDFLASQKGHLRDLWLYPDITNQFIIDAEQRQMQLGNQTIKLPALIEIDANDKTTNIAFEFNSYRKLSQRILDIPSDQALVWVDNCSLIRAFSTVNQPYSDGLCVAAGKMGGENTFLKSIDGQTSLNYEDLRPALTSAIEQSRTEKVREQLKVGGTFGEFPLPLVTLPEAAGLKSTVSLFTSGHPLDGRSFILNEAVQYITAEGDRGLNLLVLSPDGVPGLIANVNICRGVAQPPVRTDFANLIREQSEQAKIFIVTTNHLAKCLPDKQTVEFYLKGLPFKQWQDIVKRRSFIGVLVDDTVMFEKIGKKVDGKLSLQIQSELLAKK